MKDATAVTTSIYRVYLMKVGEFTVSDDRINSPQTAAKVVRDFFEDQYNGVMSDREVLIAIYLNTKNRIAGVETISIGSINASIAHPREIYKGAILHNSYGIILAHNHPSGDVTPSPEDHNMTHQIYEAGQLLGIDLMDHIIIGEQGKYLSFKEQGYI